MIKRAQMVTPMEEGLQAYDNGECIDECPYQEGTEERGEWQEGWLMARGEAEGD